MEKSIICLIILLSVNLYGCSKIPAELESEREDINTIDHEVLITEESEDSISLLEWQDAYKNIIRDIQGNLVDPTNYYLEFGFYGYVYLGIHDFDNNGIPELIISDGISAAVFTYEDGKAEKVADLYEPEEWGGINLLCYKDNNLVLISSGSGGSGYVCFSYDWGGYITGFYCDYHSDEITINEKSVSREEFLQKFDVIEWEKYNIIPYSKIINENDIILAGSDESIAIDDLDFNAIEW